MFKMPIPVINWSNFLDQDTIEMARQVVRDNRHNFQPTTTSTNEPDFRSSVVLWHHHYQQLNDVFSNRIREMLPQLRSDMQEYTLQTEPSKIEVQLTNHFKNNDHFSKHVDNASTPGLINETPNRRLTCVYYFNMHDGANRFEGGDLYIYLANGTMTIRPIHNSVVFLPSHVWHEVQPITSQTEDFFDGRFTLNSWVHG